MNKPYIIVGGGMAGSFLAARLAMAGKEVRVIDDGNPAAASRVAAGMFNVITGRFGAKSWMAETLLAALNEFLSIPEFQTVAGHFRFAQVYRPFKTIEEYNKWTGRSVDPAFAHLAEMRETPLHPEKIINPHGGILIKPCGWADTNGILEEIRHILTRSFGVVYVDGSVEAAAINVAEKRLSVAGDSLFFDHLIFCEGYRSATNPLFPDIRIIPNKGEILIIHAPELKIDFAISKKIYLIPAGNDRYIVGSTYQNKFDDPAPSEAGKAQICESLEKAIRAPYQIEFQKAAIRPTTPDRRPLAGTHPEHSFVHIFTGFGTKGILASPYLSGIMADYILGNRETVLPEISLQRFRKKS